MHRFSLFTLRLGMLLLVSGLLFSSCKGAGASSTGTDLTNSRDFNAASLNKDILYYVNEHRQSMGLTALKSLPVAAEQAAIHSRNMALRKTGFGHSGFKKRVATITATAGMMRASAENVAYGNLSAKEVVKGWLNSPGHRKNIEGNYTLTGIGVYQDRKGVIFFTQLFMRP